MAKDKPNRDEVREDRIMMEIIVDSNGAEEQAMGWFYYLEEQLQFPFTAICIAKRAISPLRVKDEVEVTGMSRFEECEREMFVTIHGEKGDLAVPLSSLKPIDKSDEATKQAVEDWHYWVQMGYEF